MLFAWLLTLHSTAAKRTDAAHGAVDGLVLLAWLRLAVGVPFGPRERPGSATPPGALPQVMGEANRPSASGDSSPESGRGKR